MTPPLFLAPAALPGGGSLREAARFTLDGAEGRHAAVVRRLRVGERVDVTDGAGLVAACRVSAVGRDRLDLEVLGRREVGPASPRLVVVQALAKGDRGEAAVEAMTEVGVDAVVPWAAARSVTLWHGERGARALERWRSTAREAAKQSRRAWLPEVTEPATTVAVCDRIARAALGVVLDADAPAPLVGTAVPAAGDVVLVVGPEGDITPEEAAAFAAAGAVSRRLGPTVLRTSTAGVVAAALVLAAARRWA